MWSKLKSRDYGTVPPGTMKVWKKMIPNLQKPEEFL